MTSIYKTPDAPHLESQAKFSRIGDNKFLVKTGNTKVIVSPTDNIKEKPDVIAYLLKECLPSLPKSNEQKAPIKVGSRQFQWVPYSKGDDDGFLVKASSIVNNFFFPPSDEGIKKYKLLELPSDAAKRISKGDPAVLSQETELLNMTNVLITEGLEFEEIKHGIRGKLPLPASDELKSPRFSDPYTVLSAKAFQSYEKDFTSKDKLAEDPSNCEMCLIQKGSYLLLEKKSQASPKSNQATVKNYYHSLINQYGKEKIAYIEHLFGLDFNKMIKKGGFLTPEHVYRVNMGLTNLEVQDLSSTFKNLKKFFNQAQFLASNENLEAIFSSKEVIFEGDEVSLAGFEKKAILAALSKIDPNPTIKTFLNWSNELNLHADTFADLDVIEAGKLINLFALKPEERERALTGRAIFESILGWYNSGELEKYKPWVDQQQLIQSIAEYENSTEIEAFYELLSFAIVKLHLVKDHPTEGFRVGGIIPGPLQNDGQRQWYTVSSCVSNGYGNFNYTLEGVGKNSSLPALKLYRSTAASPYCMHGQSSVWSDINPLNSPGYLGRGLGDQYEKSFFEERSIPVWVGYVFDAKNKLETSIRDSNTEELQSIGDALIKANATLLKSNILPFTQLNMRQLISKHDAILLEILSQEGSLAPSFITNIYKNNDELAHFSSLIEKLKLKYLSSDKIPTLMEQKQDAAELIVFLRRFAAKKLKPHQMHALSALQNDLETHLQKEGVPLVVECNNALKKNDSQMQQLSQYEKQFQTETMDFAKTSELLQRWVMNLENLAQSKKEHPSQKKNQEVVLLGHSLGGALAQLYTQHYYTAQERVPLPKEAVKMYSFDGPGINTEDNMQFKSFGNEHAALLNNLKINFEVHHSQESGDPIPFAGKDHLCATHSQTEADQVESWVKFFGGVYERNLSAQSSTIAQSATAHATRFRLGIEGIDYKKTFYSSIYQGLMDSGGKMGALQAEHLAESMKKKMWRVDFFDSPTTEKIRSSTRSALMYFLLNERDTTVKGEQYFDEKGVLAVNTSGIVSGIGKVSQQLP